MCIYLKNNPVKFHPAPIWNDNDRLFEDDRPNKNNKNKNKNNNKMSSDMGSVPDSKNWKYW